MANGTHWDGSPVDDGTARSRLRGTMRLHKSSQSQTLRQHGINRCLYCHHPMEWYERFDTKTWLPLLQQVFPSRLVPERYHWSVFNGLVYLGDGGSGECRIAHPSMCPAMEHDDERALRRLRGHYAVTTRKWIEQGAFVPTPQKEVSEEDVVEQIAQADTETRHVITYTYWTWLGPSAIDEICCVARAHSTSERCQNPVFDSDLGEGTWTQVERPMPRGRTGHATLWSGQKMWVFDLNALYPDEYKRWRSQRCTSHAKSSAPDVKPPQWIPFDALRHDAFVVYDRPTAANARKRNEHPLKGLVQPLASAGRCSAEGCSNRSHRSEEDGWLCWVCEPIARRRARTHEQWQKPSLEKDPPF
ncbi:DUF6083 domain-containing protein [Streptomyces sp. AC154]|uniref:DUF6083 domain-containing protein n=1 Tax=Streptomyces sp. AC154 TaxID=3143184 RepID=UPI003F800595